MIVQVTDTHYRRPINYVSAVVQCRFLTNSVLQMHKVSSVEGVLAIRHARIQGLVTFFVRLPRLLPTALL